MKYYLSIFCLILLFSCSKNGKTKENKNTSSDEKKLNCLVIKFLSPGDGIDYERNDKLLDFFKTNNIAFQVKNWGREGEKTYSIDLTSVDADKQKKLELLTQEFKANSKKIFTEKLINCTENQ